MKHAIVKYMKLLYEKDLTSALSGNISMRDGDLIYISPSKIPKYRIQHNDVAVVTLTGEHCEGLAPSSELPTHLAIYNTSNVNAVIHVHSHYATLFACLKQEIKPLDVECRSLLHDVPLIGSAEPGSKKLAKLVVEGLRGHKAVLMDNHGPLVVGVHLEDAFLLTESLERAARLQFECLLINCRRSE